ncbi:MAG: hypothetical protein KBD53_09230 [Candidatus Omnitrophica bacterium]|nr:hypothetical protein [Candidatus Omnitrophota bacterium]
MTAKKIRVILRWVHIVCGLVIMCFIYSPFHEYSVFQWIMKLIIIPVVTFTGIWVWKFRQFNKFFKIIE